jgi:hypothetical protein
MMSMKIFRHVRVAAFVALGMLAAAVGGALGQAGWYQIASPTGLETLQAFLNASAYQNYVTINQVRNTTGYLLSPAITGTVSLTSNTNRAIFNTATLGTVTLNLPPNPPDGQMAEVVNGTGAAFTTGVTVATTDGSTLVGAASTGALAASGSVEWQYTAPSKIWYRLR